MLWYMKLSQLHKTSAKLVSLSLLLFTLPVFAGSMTIVPANAKEQGISIDNIGSGTLSVTAAGISVSGSQSTVILSGFTVRKGFKWQTLTLKLNSTGGSVSASIRTTGNQIVQTQTGLTTSTSIDFSGSDLAQSGDNFLLVLEMQPNVTVTSITVTYNGSGMIAYPTPYYIHKGNLTFSYDLPSTATVNLVIFDNRGRVVKKIRDHALISTTASNRVLDSWNGTNSAGQKVATGVYRAIIEVKPLGTSRGQSYTNVFPFLVLR